MFILIEIPFADLRPLIKGGLGRVSTPDWTGDDPGNAFVRGFGKVASRNSKSFGLVGERYFADFNNAVRLREPLVLRQEGWPAALNAELRFRRLYYDGRLAGRFEFGFLVDDDEELKFDRHLRGVVIDPRQTAAAALASHIGVIAPECDEQATTINGCAKLLGQAYLAATTQKSELNSFAPAEVYGHAVALGAPIVHIRIANGLRTDVGRDRADADGTDGALFFTSASKGQLRNNVIVRLSKAASEKETGQERAVRVLFAHLHALMYAQSHFLGVQKSLDLGGRAPLQDAVADMINRLGNFLPTAPSDETDEPFAEALAIWGQAHAGRAAELVDKLNALANDAMKPGFLNASLALMNSLVQLAITTGVKTAVEQGAKGIG